MQAPGAPTRNMPSAATLSALASVNIATSKGFTEEATFPLDETLDWSTSFIYSASVTGVGQRKRRACLGGIGTALEWPGRSNTGSHSFYVLRGLFANGKQAIFDL